MQVETYEVPETSAADGTVENEAEAVALIDKLNLEGQKKLTKGEGETRSRIPYRMMTVEEANVYGQLLPRHENLNAYAAGPIPVRVLQVAAHALSLSFFDHLQVWHSAGAEKDPVLVGCAGRWSDDRYLLARWGDELEAFPTLAKKAAKLIRGKKITALDSIQARVVAHRTSLKDIGDEVLLAKKFEVPVLYHVDD